MRLCLSCGLPLVALNPLRVRHASCRVKMQNGYYRAKRHLYESSVEIDAELSRLDAVRREKAWR